MQTFLNYLVGYGYPIVTGLVEVLIVIAIIWAISTIVTYINEKTNGSLKELIEDSTEIKDKIRTVVRYINQTMTDKMKKDNNGVLTDEQQEELMNTAISLIKKILSNDEVEYLANKYNLDLDEVLKILTEVQVREVKNYD